MAGRDDRADAIRAVAGGGAVAGGSTVGNGVRTTGHRPASAGPNRLRAFNPIGVGRLEAAVWVAYYRREWAKFLALSVLLVRNAFGMDWVRTVYGAWLVLRANMLWAPPEPDGDPAGARRCMRRFYALLRLVHGEPVDPARAAQLEVEWWAVHRAHQRGDSGDPQPLVDALSRLYAFVFGIDEMALWPAAEHRARAMDISDQWVDEGCRMDSPLLPAERAALVRSYAALLAAVHH
jgi:hypothetical protein